MYPWVKREWKELQDKRNEPRLGQVMDFFPKNMPGRVTCLKVKRQVDKEEFYALSDTFEAPPTISGFSMHGVDKWKVGVIVYIRTEEIGGQEIIVAVWPAEIHDQSAYWGGSSSWA